MYKLIELMRSDNKREQFRIGGIFQLTDKTIHHHTIHAHYSILIVCVYKTQFYFENIR